MATQQEVEAAKRQGRDIAKDFAHGDAEEQHLGRTTLYCWAYEPKSEHNAIVLEGDFNDAQRNAIYDAGCESLPL
jgi:hypothetical protein